MNRRIILGLTGMWLAAAGAFGQSVETNLPGGLQLDRGKILSTSFARVPVRLKTTAGTLSFLPDELESIEFSPTGRCEVTTVYQDRWVVEAGPHILLPLITEAGLYDVLTRVKRAIFLSPAVPGDPIRNSWEVDFRDGSVVHLVPEQETLHVDANDGRIEIAWGLIESLTWSVSDILATVEIVPGGHAIQGFIRGASFRAKDLGGRRLALPWDSLAQLAPEGRKPSRRSPLVWEQAVDCRLIDGQAVTMKVPVSILAVTGRGGTWSLPTTRILRVEKNPDGSHSVQTTAGEWLSGTVRPQKLPASVQGMATDLLFSDCMSAAWANEPVEMPTNCLAWRLKTGDLLVGEWAVDPVEVPSSSASSLRVRSPASMPSARPLPAQIDGKWPVSRFEVVHWASGGRLRLSASAVEAIGADSISEMPPAISSAGPSAVRSDEILMPGGSFRMGRTRGEGGEDEIPPVDLSVESFWLANTPVTVAQFEAFAADTGHLTDPERTPAAPTWRAPGFAQRPDAPVVCVTWRDAVRYCNWRSAQAGLKPCYAIRRDGQEVVFHPEFNGYRLPLEAEWEYAARSGGQDVVYPWGDEADEESVADLANFRPSGPGLDPWPWTNPVKSFPPSAAGLHDMGGNVWEWCQDIYREDAYSGALRGEGMEGVFNAGPARENRRVMRGGSYHNGLEFLRCAARGHGFERMNAPRVGFRVARNAEAGAR